LIMFRRASLYCKNVYKVRPKVSIMDSSQKNLQTYQQLMSKWIQTFFIGEKIWISVKVKSVS
jgi:hypothetical protein